MSETLLVFKLTFCITPDDIFVNILPPPVAELLTYDRLVIIWYRFTTDVTLAVALLYVTLFVLVMTMLSPTVNLCGVENVNPSIGGTPAPPVGGTYTISV